MSAELTGRARGPRWSRSAPLLVLTMTMLCAGPPAVAGGGTAQRGPRPGAVRGPAPVIEAWERGPIETLPPVPRRPWEGLVSPATGGGVTRVGGAGRFWKNSRVTRPQGALAGKTIYLSPGHGWSYVSSWLTQRGNSYGIVEDFSNAEGVIQFLLPYLWNASAYVVPVREVGMNHNRVVLDDADGAAHPGDGLVEEIGDAGLFTDSAQSGYGRFALPLTGSTNPFALGGNRVLETNPGSPTARFRYTFNVPADGFYNVYISYSAWTGRADDAHYIVKHPGGEAHFRVDQQHHGATWVLLGRFWFAAGTDAEGGAVELLNDTDGSGTQVSADAIRLGAGMGLMDRGGGTSGWPRYLENCRYHAQYAGAPASVYDGGGDDRSDDVACRSRLAGWVHETGEDALYFAWHSNAGGGTGTSIYIYWPNSWGFCDGSEATAGSLELADAVLDEVVGDVRAAWDPAWTDRGRRCAWFGEVNPSYNPDMPAALIELAFHDLPEDVEDLAEPGFRRVAARAMYQGMVRYFAERDGVEPVYLPEPPTAPAARNLAPGVVEVSWGAPDPDGAGAHPATSYRFFQGPNGVAFDEGQDVGSATRLELTDLADGELRFFRITAVNAGGESWPSSVVGVGASPTGDGRAPLLIVDGFDRLDGSLNWAQDAGGALGVVDRMVLSRMHDPAGIRRHGPEAVAHGVGFDSAHHRGALRLDLSAYRLVDYAAGRGVWLNRSMAPALRKRLDDFMTGGGQLLASGSHLASDLSGGDSDDLAFLAGRLHADGAVVGPGGTVTPPAAELLEGLGELTLHDGDGEGYDVGIPDGLSAGTDGVTVATWSAGGAVAALRSPDQIASRSVLLGFPLEGVADPVKREGVMGALLGFFDLELPDAGVQTADASGGDRDAGPPCPGKGDEGCNCRAANGGGAGRALPALLILLAFVMVRRRRRGHLRRRPPRAALVGALVLVFVLGSVAPARAEGWRGAFDAGFGVVIGAGAGAGLGSYRVAGESKPRWAATVPLNLRLGFDTGRYGLAALVDLQYTFFWGPSRDQGPEPVAREGRFGLFSAAAELLWRPVSSVYILFGAGVGTLANPNQNLLTNPATLRAEIVSGLGFIYRFERKKPRGEHYPGGMTVSVESRVYLPWDRETIDFTVQAVLTFYLVFTAR